MLNGLDLFSGIGGISLALAEWVRPITYCEIEPYAQAVLASRMSERRLPIAPIWDDVRTLSASVLPTKPDIIYGGFPCQDISVAGRGKGLAGERSGLFSEIMRLVREIQPAFIFLENVPAIRTRGLDAVIKEIADCGYDCRWTNLSAKEVGANHRRDRFWLLGYSKHLGPLATTQQGSPDSTIQHNTQRADQASKLEGADTPRMLAREPYATNANSERGWLQSQHQELQNTPNINNDGSEKFIPDTRCQQKRASESLQSESQESVWQDITELCSNISDTSSERLEGQWQKPCGVSQELSNSSDKSWWSVEPSVGRVVNGLPFRVDRIKCLGNAVVPEAARQAFMMLSGLSTPTEKAE